MGSLNDKLRLLGIELGVQNIQKPREKYPYSIEKVLNAKLEQTKIGDVYTVESEYPIDYLHGKTTINIDVPLSVIADWVGNPSVNEIHSQELSFIDVESTGLSGGTGTYAFLIGVGKFEQDRYRIVQYFMNDPTYEPAQLAALEQFLASVKSIVSFNGKAFDIPLLNARYTFHGWKSPFKDMIHIDLLHLARRLWRDRIPSRTLSNLEFEILRSERTEEDIPGWMVPSIYFEYLQDRDPRPLKRIFYHNEIDVLSLSALLNHMAGLLVDPLSRGHHHASDLLAIGRLYEDIGNNDAAVSLYTRGLEHDDITSQRINKEIMFRALYRLSMIYNRSEEFSKAIRVWQKAATNQHIESCIELAKYFEHRTKDYGSAIHWTNQALSMIEKALENDDMPYGVTNLNVKKTHHELLHRLQRVKSKLEGKITESK